NRSRRRSPAPAATTPTAAAPARALPFDQLPADVRRSLPALAIGGAIYSEQPSARMLLVGGQLLHEGDAAAPGVTLEHIGQRSAVLRWRDLRYEVAY
ncbi:general secretion pathway protein GspB, partial [Rubrivivax gelatinosus]|uniref:general secretion pathway protein GspB n=1 Tax=Rubrivivax gelatinosus TaxID=28068 RepID=UPI001A920465